MSAATRQSRFPFRPGRSFVTWACVASCVALTACRPAPQIAPDVPVETPLPRGARLVPLRELIPLIEATIDELRLVGSWSRTTGQWVYVGVARSPAARVDGSGDTSGGDSSGGDSGDDAGAAGSERRERAEGIEEDTSDETMRHVIRAVSVREDASRLVWLVGPGEDAMRRDRALEARVHERWESSRTGAE